MFDHLLLPLSGTRLDDEAIHHARSLALMTGGDLQLIYVLEPHRRGNQFAPIDILEWHAVRADAEAYVKRVADDLRDAGVKVDYSLPEGQTTEHIIHQAHQGVDLMILPTGAFGREQVGSLGGQVLWRSYVSTLLVRGRGWRRSTDTEPRKPTTRPADRVAPSATGPGAEAPVEDVTSAPAAPAASAASAPLFRTVLVALDGCTRAECVLPAVRFLAQKSGAKIILAHVVEEPALPRLVPPTAEELELARRLVDINTAVAKDYLLDVQARLGFDVERRLAVGRSAAAELHKMVDDAGVDLVIMSAHGYGGDQEWPFGEVVTNLIGYGETSLLVIHDVPWTERVGTHPDVTDEAWGR
ncbi:MAG TPA: universal stress protein [Trueperaceae bacterium]|nr:universal stress protein [Trueperaceae bacterium]